MRVAITDFKQPVDIATQPRGTAPFIVDERAVNDYYPYGMLIPERSYSSSDYRYGYGGHELDNEVKGTGNHLSFGEYGYDTRTGKRWNIEPLIKQVPFMSSYATFYNNPIKFKDPSGKFGIDEHFAISVQAYLNVMGYFYATTEFLTKGEYSPTVQTAYHMYTDLLQADQPHKHLDNYTNANMKELFSKGGMEQLELHTLQDFYCHSNYIEIMLELGFDENTMPIFSQLDDNGRRIVLDRLQTTNNNTPDIYEIWQNPLELILRGEFKPTNEPNNRTDHDITDVYEILPKEIKDTPDVFYSKHAGHNYNSLAKRLALEETEKRIAKENGRNWIPSNNPVEEGCPYDKE